MPGTTARFNPALLPTDVVIAIAQAVEKSGLKHALLMNDGNKLACDESSSFKGSSLHSSLVLWIFTLLWRDGKIKNTAKALLNTIFSSLLSFNLYLSHHFASEIFLFDDLSKIFWNSFRNLSQLDVKFWQVFEKKELCLTCDSKR